MSPIAPQWYKWLVSARGAITLIHWSAWKMATSYLLAKWSPKHRNLSFVNERKDDPDLETTTVQHEIKKKSIFSLWQLTIIRWLLVCPLVSHSWNQLKPPRVARLNRLRPLPWNRVRPLVSHPWNRLRPLVLSYIPLKSIKTSRVTPSFKPTPQNISNSEDACLIVGRPKYLKRSLSNQGRTSLKWTLVHQKPVLDTWASSNCLCMTGKFYYGWLIDRQSRYNGSSFSSSNSCIACRRVLSFYTRLKVGISYWS